MAADFVYAGDAPAVAQVGTVTVAYVDGTSTLTLTINGKSITATAVTDTDTTGAAVVTAWNNSTYPEFAEVTAAYVADGVITLTADTAGVPFGPVTTSESGNDTISDYSAVTACSGPECWVAANVKALADGSRALPGATDTIYFRDSSVNLKYGLDTSFAGAYVYFDASYTGQVGLPETNSGGYSEYRTRYFDTDSATLYIGNGSGSGSSKLRVSNSSGPINIENTGSSADGNGAVEVNIEGECTTQINMANGACYVTSTSTSGSFSALTLTGGTVETDDMILVSTATLRGNSSLTSYGPLTVLQIFDNARCYYNLSTGSITSTAWRIYSGVVYCGCTENTTVTLLVVGPGGVVDLTDNLAAITLTNTTMSAGASLLDPNGILILSNAIDLGTAGLEDVNLNLGKNLDITKG